MSKLGRGEWRTDESAMPLVDLCASGGTWCGMSLLRGKLRQVYKYASKSEADLSLGWHGITWGPAREWLEVSARAFAKHSASRRSEQVPQNQDRLL